MTRLTWEGTQARRRPPSTAAAYLVAVTATTVMVLLRWALDPWMGNNLPFVTLFGSVAAAVWFGGFGPALVSTVLGFLTCGYLFIEPRGALNLTRPHEWIGLVLYLFTCLLIIGIGQAMRHAQRRSRESQELMRITFSSIGDALITTDTEGRVTYMNPLAASVTGWTSAEAAGRPIESVFRIVHETTRQPAPDPVSRALRDGTIVGPANHTLLITRDGAERPIDDSAAPIRSSEGEIHGCVLVFRDISERRKAEEALKESVNDHQQAELGLQEALQRLRIVTDSMSAPVTRCSRDLRYVWVSKSYAEWIGRPPEEIQGRPILDVIGADAFERLLPRFHEVLSGEPVRYEEEINFLGIGPRWVSAVYTPTVDPGGAVDGWVAVVIDTTEHKRMEEALRVADRRKDEFLAALAHELRNPLAPIRNAVQILLLKGPPDPELRWCREVIDRQVNHMARLLDDLLDVSRITHGKLDLRRERIDLASAVRSAVEASRPLMERGGQRLSVTLPPEPVVLEADPVRLAQVVSNLLDNASKFSPPGGRIRLTAAQEGRDVVVSVEDEGVGIAVDMLPRVFDIFSQAEPEAEGLRGGLGIGLSLVKGLVEMSGGSVEARSDGPGKGSRFIVRLPAALEPATRRKAPSDREEEQAPVTRRRILIVDDLKDCADSLAMFLKVMGHEVHTAYDGEDAFLATERLTPEVVLLDLGMPKMNGYEVCRRIRQQPRGRGILLIALTGWGQEDDRRRTADAGFDHHLIKPVEPRELLRLLVSAPAQGAGSVDQPSPPRS